MERNEAIQAAGLEEYEVYTTTSSGPVWTGLASSPIHAMDLYCKAVDETYVGYTAAIDQDEETTLTGLNLVGDTLWGVFENTEIYAQRRAVAEARALPVNTETIGDVVEAASEAFWAKVQESFHAEHGDLDPLTTIALGQAQERAVTEWVAANVKKHYVAVVFDVTGLSDEQAGHVAAEATVQGEANENHPGVRSCTIQTTTEGGTMDDFLDDLPEGWGEF